jgi:hypothetical protein
MWLNLWVARLQNVCFIQSFPPKLTTFLLTIKLKDTQEMEKAKITTPNIYGTRSLSLQGRPREELVVLALAMEFERLRF